MNIEFWNALDQLIASSKIMIDRPKGSTHPRYPEIIYPLDYGYLAETTSPDGAGIDLWQGSHPIKSLTAILVTVDLVKRDSEIKLLLGCTTQETQTIFEFLNKGQMRATLINRPIIKQGDSMNTIPEKYHDLLADETKAFLFLATSMSDGSPQVTPVWFNHNETHILINSAKGRLKDKNMRARPQVAFVIQDPVNPYRYLQIRGKVVEITEAGADAHIDALAFKYQGLKSYPYRKEGEVRVTYKILPDKIDAH